jgi:predicted acylesterase/phospholipase RssA
MKRILVILGVAIGVLGAVAIGGYFSLQGPARLPAVPPELTARAEVPGIPGARYVVPLHMETFVRDVLAAREREARALGVAEDALPIAEFLAVSGGGDKGAFGAGLLNGWSESGQRPQFKAVTGVSTGALIAPFAFLGPEYDRVLREVYTSLGPADIAEKRSLLAAIADDGMADNRPLWNQLSRYVDEALLRRIAEEHARGRILLVGTTNLDARRPVVWNMGAIAASGDPGALDLFRHILLASAAIPGAFPPTMVRVEVDGRSYEEMHVDGGASAQVFMYPPRMRSVAASLGEAMAREARVYVLRNSFLDPSPLHVERRTMSIAGRAISSLIHTQGLGDLMNIYATAERDGVDFNLAYIDDDFRFEHKTDFDTEFMRALFDYGYRLGRDGYPWRKVPPQLEQPL